MLTSISIIVTIPDCLASTPVMESKLLFFDILPPLDVPVKPAATCSPSSRNPFPNDFAAFNTVAV